MRLFISNLLFTMGLLLLSASTASAISLYLHSPITTIGLGDTVTVELLMDTEGETQVTSVFTSVGNDNSLALSFTSGTSPGQILFNTSTFEGVARVSNPVDGVPGDAAGRIRAANFATATPTGSGVASAKQLLATLIFTGTQVGDAILAPLAIVGSDEVTVATVSVTGQVSLGEPLSITVIPEPGTALLMGLGLAGLTAAGRRRMA